MADPHSYSFAPLKQRFNQIIHKNRPILHRCSQQLGLLLPDRIYGRFPTGHGSGGELFVGKSQRLQLETPVRLASFNFMA
jgi:hypothetical protein